MLPDSVSRGTAGPLPAQKHCLVLAPRPSAPTCVRPQIIKQSILELRLQAEDSFVLKVVQLEELLQVRHSVFVIGNAGSGKSQAGGRVRPQPSASQEAPPIGNALRASRAKRETVMRGTAGRG